MRIHELDGSREEEVYAAAVLLELRSVISEMYAFLSRESLTDYRWRTLGRWLKKSPSDLDWLWQQAMMHKRWWEREGLVVRMQEVVLSLKERLEDVEQSPPLERLIEHLNKLEEIR
tara:strand:+ start:2672 stop:3019 length:348 start_codon:yes stop_codon:yes gene_type:complete